MKSSKYNAKIMEMQAENKPKTQSEILAEKLVAIARDVTKADRAALLLAYENIKASTLSNYLNGKVRDNDTAVTILTFCQKRIADRYQAIA